MGMTVNELREALEYFSDDTNVEFDFGGYPVYIDSWRGSYNKPAMYFTMDYEEITIGKLKEMLSKVDGQKATGWKGGEFILSADEILWITPEPNMSNSTTISSVSKESYSVVLNTKYEEY